MKIDKIYSLRAVHAIHRDIEITIDMCLIKFESEDSVLSLLYGLRAVNSIHRHIFILGANLLGGTVVLEVTNNHKYPYHNFLKNTESDYNSKHL